MGYAEGDGLVSHLSAMTVEHGGVDLYEAKRAALGEDPLRADANPDALWAKVRTSSKSIGALLMDQGYFAGVGNIFRCEILLVAGVHPEVKGKQLTRDQFDTIWKASVDPHGARLHPRLHRHSVAGGGDRRRQAATSDGGFTTRRAAASAATRSSRGRSRRAHATRASRASRS